MLVLTRKTDETIVIDERIKVRILQIKGCRVRIGIEAPVEVPIRRSEISAKETEGGLFADDEGKAPEWAELDLASLS